VDSRRILAVRRAQAFALPDCVEYRIRQLSMLSDPILITYLYEHSTKSNKLYEHESCDLMVFAFVPRTKKKLKVLEAKRRMWSHVFCAMKAPLKFAVQKFKSTLLSTVLTIMLSAPLVELTISTVQYNNIKQPIPQQTVYYIIRIDLNRRILSRSIRSHHINTGTHVPFRQRPFPLSVPFHTNSLSSGLPP